jgi:hypothetical protein
MKAWLLALGVLVASNAWGEAGISRTDTTSDKQRPIQLAQTKPWKGTQADMRERCDQTGNFPGKHFYVTTSSSGQTGYCCTNRERTQGWCCWDRGGGRVDCGAR